MNSKTLVVAIAVATSSVFIPVSANIAQAIAGPTSPPLLGPADPTEGVKQTSLGINYEPNGFDTGGGYKKNGIKRKMRQKYIDVWTPQWLNSMHFNALIQPFQDSVQPYVSDPSYMPEVIDQSYRQIRDSWLACNNTIPGTSTTFRQVAQNYDPHNLRVTAVENAFVVTDPAHVLPDILSVGVVWDKYHVQATISFVSPAGNTDPSKAYLRNFKDLVPWEIGNAFGKYAGYDAHGDVNKELGSFPPCGAGVTSTSSSAPVTPNPVQAATPPPATSPVITSPLKGFVIGNAFGFSR